MTKMGDVYGLRRELRAVERATEKQRAEALFIPEVEEKAAAMLKRGIAAFFVLSFFAGLFLGWLIF